MTGRTLGGEGNLWPGYSIVLGDEPTNPDPQSILKV